ATARAIAQRTQRARVEIDRVSKNGKLSAILGERLRTGACADVELTGKRHRPSIYRRTRAPGTPRDYIPSHGAIHRLAGTRHAARLAGAREPAARARSPPPRLELPGARLVPPRALSAGAAGRLP